MKYVAFVSPAGQYHGWTTKDNYQASLARGFNMIEEDETLVEFEHDSYDDTDQMFLELKQIAQTAVYMATGVPQETW
jgi:hypothetical protein